jgi:putative PIN family toxin of toxin-antitoxin system
MPTDRIYVFDANVLVSAVLLSGSVPRQAFDRASARGRLALSQTTINELDDVLRRPRLDRYIHEDERIQFFVALVREARVVTVSETVRACRDPKDNGYLELALSSGAICIVTGDHDLRSLDGFRGVRIVSPREFLDSGL